MRITIAIPNEFAEKCGDEGLKPDQALQRFMADVCALDNSGGSNERDAAQGWFWQRCGRRDR
ncbi:MULTISPECIES: hypothetical protein [unclassified Bradyrhizobium]|uniref:hypothetical protein n=1 Tax=unclassified Bradyrhizobium TaxID=2631580 RepID=UPI002916A2E9|nr:MULTISPECIES: hypothetical protein [unclassified Bradyrhizobium]